MAENRLAPNTPARSGLRANTAWTCEAALLASSSLNWVSSTAMSGNWLHRRLKPSSRWSVVEMPGLTLET